MSDFIGLNQMMTNADRQREERRHIPIDQQILNISYLHEGLTYSLEEEKVIQFFTFGNRNAGIDNVEETIEVWLALLRQTKKVLYFLKDGIYYFYRDYNEIAKSN